jgi:predicted hotdog family 3-hydroxylacyl-ACP dehydratase
LKLPPYRIDELLPHARPMILLDEVICVDEGTLTAALTIRPGVPFFEAGRGVAAHVAIEWMAQACGAYVGVAALDAREPIRLGLLLGTRNFEATVPWFLDGERLQVTVTLAYMDSEMGAFDCVVTRATNGDALAKACLTLYHPDDAMTLLTAQASQMNE